MSTILYLDNHYIQSLNDLKQVVEKADGDLKSLLFKEIRAAFYNKTIEEWLSEGSEEEKELAAKIREISRRLMDNDLLEQLNVLLADKKIKVEKPKISQFAVAKAFRYIFGGKELVLTPEKNLSIDNYKGNIDFCIDFEIFESGNYEYNVVLGIEYEGDCKEVRMGKTLNLKTKEKKQTINFEFSTESIKHKGILKIDIENETIHKIDILRYPRPRFAQVCTMEQKMAIYKLIKRLIYVQGNVKYNSSVGKGFAETTYTNYYISHLITVSDYKMTESTSNDFFKCGFDKIYKYLNKLNGLSGLNFEIIDETQWEFVAKSQIIEFGIFGEWVINKSNRERVIKGQKKNNISNRELEGYGETANCFRIILPID